MSESRERGADRLVPIPSQGRLFTGSRRVRLGDVRPSGRLRLDALARYLQDVSSDDTTDAGLTDDVAWVVRRTVIEVHRPAVFREMLTLTTFCAGIGSRWAERRVSVAGVHGAVIEAATLWVHVDLPSGRPSPLPDQFGELFGAAAAGRRVSARLVHDSRPPSDAPRRAWPLRVTDLDLFDHVNNAASWSLVEEAMADRAGIRPPYRAELEYRDPIERGARVALAVRHGGQDAEDGFDLWAVDASAAEAPPYLTGVVRPL